MIGEDCLSEVECWELFSKACDNAAKVTDYRMMFNLCLNGLCTYAFINNKKYLEVRVGRWCLRGIHRLLFLFNICFIHRRC